ncbi:Gfo/Idh/MocA family protein [Paenibacillus cymbidii]|uniref:Gfo/Idh/MocA family protein n=1 Tax=Paenibacillus cymbidii TaxID=1639034 RepID=UPI0014366F34|nr:Gfo/Idh/MocA family oxidoreductase [Paenibacillus cymbidii]
MEQVRVGIIGVGGMAEHHMKTLRQVERAQITAVCDINRERARHIAATYETTAFESAEELLDSGAVDAVYVCTPPFARNGIEAGVARRGIHLLSEKPVGLNMDEVRATAAAIKQAGIINSSGYCLRYLDTVQKAKAYLVDKQIGMVLGYRIGGLPGAEWWRKMELSGGQLVEMSTHQVDQIRYVAGEFASIHAIHEQRNIRNQYPEADVYDVGVLSFTLQSGAAGNFCNTSLSRHFGRADVEVFGHDFYLALNGNGTTLRIVDDEQDITVKSKYDFYLEQSRAFVEAVRTGNQQLILCDYNEAVSTLEVTLAANEAAKTGKTVFLSSASAVQPTRSEPDA